jgi:hypothetical protein
MDANIIQIKKDRPYAVKSGEDALMVKDVDFSKRIVTGLYNTALFFDSDYDVLLKGCADKSMRERGPQSNSIQKIKHLLFHSWQRLPGKILVLEERTVEINGKTVTGIYFETKMDESTDGVDTLIKYQEQIYDNHSIGFQYLDGEWVDSDAEDWQKYVDMLINPEAAEGAGFMYIWKEIRLLEGSTVAFGANELTPYLGVKSGNKEGMLLKVNERINLLTKQVANGKLSDGALYGLEMEMLQLKQIVNELFTQEPSIKDTLIKGRQQKDTSVVEGQVDMKQLLTIF